MSGLYMYMLQNSNMYFRTITVVSHVLSDVGVDVPGYGHVTVDISYAGVFYAILPASQLGLTLGVSKIGDVIDAAMQVSGE